MGVNPLQRKMMVQAMAVIILVCLATPAVLAAAASGWIAEVEALYNDRENLSKVQRSVEILRQVVSNDPQNWEAYWRLARSLRWVGEKTEKNRLPLFEEAKQMAERAVAIHPNSADAQYWLAACIGRWGEERGILQSLFAVKPMKAALDKVLEIDPDYARAYYVLSQLYRKVPGWPISIGNKKQALEAAATAVRLDPKSTTYRLELAEAQLANNMKDEAKKNLQMVLSMPLTPGEPSESKEDKETAASMLAKMK